MTIEQFSGIIETCKIAGWDYYASGDRNSYNRVKQTVDNTMILVLPSDYPTWYRGECSQPISFEIWLGEKRNIKQTTTGTQQHNPDSPIEQRDIMMAYAKTILQSISEADHILLLEAPIATFYDAPEGQSVNAQMWLKIPIKAKIIKQ